MRLCGGPVSVLCVLWAVAVLHVKPVVSECPHEKSTLRRWSDKSKWDALGLTKPTAGAKVVISDDVLLDESPPELGSIEIEAGGSLVFSPDGDYTLVTGYMMLYGALHIGSEDCAFSANAKITLKAKRKDFNVEGFGGKFIGVQSGATLELHGRNKMSWTKLTATVPKLTTDNGLLFDAYPDKTVDSYNRGFLTFVLDGTTGAMKFNRHTYMVGNSKYRLSNDPPRLFDALNNVAEGDVVMMAVQKDVIGNSDMTPFYDAIENATLGSVTNTLVVRNLTAMDAWVLIAVKGQFVKEKIETRIGDDKMRKARLMAAFPELDIAVSIESQTRPDKVMNGRSSAYVATMEAGAKILDLANDATTWRPGDRVLMTSTDFDWRQAEEGEVAYCSPADCNPNQIRLLLFPRFTHFGEVSDGVDMRAEVALLSRNVIIEGHMEDSCPGVNGNCNNFKYDTYGGHIKIEAGFSNVHIEGVELRHMGQLTDTDRHPIYFHMCSDVDSGDTPAYVKSVSIIDSYSMCVALKGTHGLLIQDNVAFNHFGHCFALLEGGDKRTVLDGNLGGGTKETVRNDLERVSTTFLITNPLTYLKNNIAAGGNKRGIWYLFPREPIGESAGKELMRLDEARRTPYAEFTNNAAHSYGHSGLFIDNELRPGHKFGSLNYYSPRVNPNDTESADQEVILDRFTGFKNRWQNAYVRGGFFTMKQASVADSLRGIYFSWSSDQMKKLQDSIIVGESDNIGEPHKQWMKELKIHYVYPRSLPGSWDPTYPIQGFVIQDGPLQLRSVWFHKFPVNENRTAAALGFLPSLVWPSWQNNDVKNLQFGFDDGPLTGNRFYEADDSEHAFGSQAGDLESILYDADGSLTGIADSTLVKPFPIYTTAQCYDKPEWGMAVCPHYYAKLKIQGGNRLRSNPILTRDDLPVSDGLESPNQVYAQFPVITGGSHSYILHWNNYLPGTVHITGRGIQQGQSVRLGVCVPRDAEIELYTKTPVWAPNLGRWEELNSIEELDLDTVGGKYFWDRANGVVFIKFLSYSSRAEDSPKECGGDRCPMVRLILKAGDASDADCRDRIGSYSRSPITAAGKLTSPATLSATSRTPPAGLGAGEFLPFRTRSVVDGGYGDWSEWGTCTTTCGGGTQIRSRACDSPIPENGGNSCSGPSEDTQACSTNPCEIHGNFSSWTVWSPCQQIAGNGGNNGYQIRSRACDSPAPRYNGDVCEGDTKEMDSCLLVSQ